MASDNEGDLVLAAAGDDLDTGSRFLDPQARIFPAWEFELCCQ